MSERASTKGREMMLASASIRPEPSSVEPVSLVERLRAAVTLGDRTGARGKHPSNIYNVAAEAVEAIVQLTETLKAEQSRADYLRVQRDGLAGNLRTGEAQYGVLDQQNKHLMARAERAEKACEAAWKSIARFPGSVHDRAMSKLEVVLKGRNFDYPKVDDEEAV